MPDFLTFRDRSPRPPTAAEVRRRRELEEKGIIDVYVSLNEAPRSFWEAILQATHWCLVSETSFQSTIGKDWWDELRWQEGWPAIPDGSFGGAYAMLIRDGRAVFLRGDVNCHVRLSAVEHLLDVTGDSSEADKFAERVNEAARRFRVGVRLEGKRFVELSSEILHQEVVRPALLLVSSPEFEAVDELYRKSFDRLLAEDPAGAITAAASSVEEMLRVGGCPGATLSQLARSARQNRWITPGVEQSIIKLDAFRGDSDAHCLGTDEPELARLVLHLVGSLLLYLGRTMKNSRNGG